MVSIIDIVVSVWSYPMWQPETTCGCGHHCTSLKPLCCKDASWLVMASRRAIGLRPEMLMLPRPHRPSMMTNHMARVRKTYGSVMESIGKRKPSRARTRTDRSFSWEICPKIAWGPCGRPRRPRCPRSVGSRSPSRQNGRGDLAISRQSPCRCAGLFRSIVLDLLPFVVVALPLFLPCSWGRWYLPCGS